MKTSDYLKISTLDELRAVRKRVSESISASERRFSGRVETTLSVFSLGKLIVPLIKKLRTYISGTPFAKS